MLTETVPTAPVATSFSRKNPFPAPLLTRRRLDSAGSEKETFHYEFSLRQSGLVYEPGDSLGAFPVNAPELVDEIINLLGCSGDEEDAGASGGSISLRAALFPER